MSESGPCRDCGLPLEGHVCGESGYGHAGVCCDCFDEGWGMSAKQRSRPRPEKDDVLASR